MAFKPLNATLGERIVNYKMLFLGLLCSLPCFGQGGQSVYLFSLDYLYPQKSFHQIESIGKELWSDLDLLLTDDQAQKKLMEENELYLHQQCIKLHNAVNNLIINETEARIYLTEDIEYLVVILEYIEDKYAQLAQSLSLMNEAILISTHEVIKQARDSLKELLENNQEVILS